MAIRSGSGYGPARTSLAPERYAPFSNSRPPPPPGGGTAPMPVPARSSAPPASARSSIPVRKVGKKKRPATAPAELELEVTTGGGGPPSAPAAGAARIRVGKRGAPDDFTAGPSFQTPHFPGQGRKLPGEAFPDVGRGAGATAGDLGFRGKRVKPILGVRASYQPFAGQAQRLDGGGLRERALQRMREIANAHEQAQGRTEALDRRGALQRAARRGGAPGDVVGLGKRKRDDAPAAFVPQRRVRERSAGPQRYTLM